MALKRIALRDFVIVRELELDLSAGFSVLTGIGRPSRWPELSTDRITTVLEACREWADHTVVDTGQYGPLQAQTLHRATGTNPLGLAEPKLCRATLADREEQLRILPLARCILIPAHRTSFPASFELRLVMRRR